MKIYIISSVRQASPELKADLEQYVHRLEAAGHHVHLPHRDTRQDASGLDICRQNTKAIVDADEVHLFYSPDSQGSHFDMGVAFAHNKRLICVNHPPMTPGKSFANMASDWAGLGSKCAVNFNDTSLPVPSRLKNLGISRLEVINDDHAMCVRIVRKNSITTSLRYSLTPLARTRDVFSCGALALAEVWAEVEHEKNTEEDRLACPEGNE